MEYGRRTELKAVQAVHQKVGAPEPCKRHQRVSCNVGQRLGCRILAEEKSLWGGIAHKRIKGAKAKVCTSRQSKREPRRLRLEALELR